MTMFLKSLLPFSNRWNLFLSKYSAKLTIIMIPSYILWICLWKKYTVCWQNDFNRMKRMYFMSENVNYAKFWHFIKILWPHCLFGSTCEATWIINDPKLLICKCNSASIKGCQSYKCTASSARKKRVKKILWMS